ncbi:MAG: O-antigen ligase family protein [Erysipelotrichaceae bacterium]|nr:O-antigen ligase family protein [Erysipelotrichaceae bacterium]
MNDIRNTIKQFKWQDWLIVLMTGSLFLPHVAATFCLLVAFLVIIYKREVLSSVHLMPGKWFLIPFLALELGVSIYYANVDGVATILNFTGLFVYLAFYHKYIHKDLFPWIMDLVILLMIAMGIYALFQFNEVSKMGGYSFTDFVIQNSPKRRISGTYLNANIFAMMLECILSIILYRFLQTGRISAKIYYVLAAFFLFFVMVLTGCRAALIPLVFVIPVLLKQAGQKKLLMVYALALIAVVGQVLYKQTIIQRIDDLSTIQSRVKIWNTAIRGFKETPFFGRGPWTYKQIYYLYDGHRAVHAHNIYLDCLLSFGIVGSGLLFLFCIALLRAIWKVKTQDPVLFGLMISLLLVIMIHGLVDGTIYPALVMMLCFMVWFNQSCLKSGPEDVNV